MGILCSYSVCACVMLGHHFEDETVVEKMSWKTGGFGCSAQGQEVIAGPRLWQTLPAWKSFLVLVLWDL